MDMNQSTIEQQRLDQARLEANGMYSSQFEKDACGMGFVVNIKGKNPTILSMMACVFQSALNTVVVLVPIRTQGMGAVFWVQIPHEFFKREMRSAWYQLACSW